MVEPKMKRRRWFAEIFRRSKYGYRISLLRLIKIRNFRDLSRNIDAPRNRRK